MPRKLQMQDYEETAQKNGGTCIHPYLPKRREKVMWKCAKGHQFAMRHDYVITGAWCPICTGGRRSWNMARVEEEFRDREIRCVSPAHNVTSIQSRLTWECEHGHQWEATIANVWHRKSGCPYCRFKAESWCREVFEEFFDSRFPKARFKWLDGLELDGFSNQRLRAFEYQGLQHFEEVAHFRIDTEALKQLQERDIRKMVLCKSHLISLYQIRHHPRDCSRKEDFQAYVEGELVAQLLKERKEFEQGTHWLQTGSPVTRALWRSMDKGV